MTAVAETSRLSADEVERYRRDGYVVPHYRLPPGQLARVRDALDRVLADNPGVRPERLISAHLERGSEGVRGSAEFLALARDPAILDMVEQVIGPDIVLWGCQIFCKQAVDGLEVPWHQDGHYWPIRPLATCTVWVALDHSAVDNGCLRVIPGSHRDRALHDHLTEERDDLALNQVLRADTFDEDEAHDIELQPGQMSMHDVYMIHGSRPNRSGRRRAGVAMRYMPATSLFDRGLIETKTDKAGLTVDFAGRPIWLLRGQDRTGRNDFTIGHQGG